jgi:hypothetical protein
MIRAVDMQAVLNQSTAVEKISQTQQFNTDARAGHFSVMAETQRSTHGSTVSESKDTDRIEFQEDPVGEHSNNRKNRKNRDPDDSHDEDMNREPGTLIDITV